MIATVTMLEQAIPGRVERALVLEMPATRATGRELIRRRLQALSEQEDTSSSPQRSLVERTLRRRYSGQGVGPRRDVDPSDAERRDLDTRLRHAIEAFERNQFMLLVDDRQLTDLDVSVPINPDTVVTFLQLVPLVGG
jgi:hypothetical protein